MNLDQWARDLEASSPLLWLIVGLLALFVFSAVMLRRSITPGAIALLWLAVAVTIGAALVWSWLDHVGQREQARRALAARAAELTARALAPGSPLACLDAPGNETVEAACEEALFASPQVIAAALAYVEARLVLLAESLAFSPREPNERATLEGWQRALETDRFGFVAQALARRGCSAEDCPAFKLLRESERVRANLRERAFDANVILHATKWRASPGAVEAAPPATPATAPASPAVSAPIAPKYSFPSAASIPPVSIMTQEPREAAPASSPQPPVASSSERQGRR